jgi:hypothetical protein
MVLLRLALRRCETYEDLGQASQVECELAKVVVEMTEELSGLNEVLCATTKDLVVLFNGRSLESKDLSRTTKALCTGLELRLGEVTGGNDVARALAQTSGAPAARPTVARPSAHHPVPTTYPPADMAQDEARRRKPRMKSRHACRRQRVSESWRCAVAAERATNVQTRGSSLAPSRHRQAEAPRRRRHEGPGARGATRSLGRSIRAALRNHGPRSRALRRRARDSAVVRTDATRVRWGAQVQARYKSAACASAGKAGSRPSAPLSSQAGITVQTSRS